MIVKFLRNRSGATSIEYCMIGAIISIAIVAGASKIGQAIFSKFYGPLEGGFN